MTTDEFVANTILKATGEVSTAVFGDDDYSKVLQFGNINIAKWAKETDWDTLYDPGVNCGTISATNSFDLDSSIRTLSNNADDYIQILNTDGSTSLYKRVAASSLQKYTSGNYCAKVGTTLRFNRTFKTTDKEYGGTLQVPAYTFPASLAKANDTVPVDDPNWLVAMTAGDWVQSDVTLAQNRPDYVAEANDLMTAMLRNNAPQVKTVTQSAFLTGLRNW